MKRKEIFCRMEELMDTYCTDCFLYKYHRSEKGRNFAHRFCITECTVGEQIKRYGKKLLQFKGRRAVI